MAEMSDKDKIDEAERLEWIKTVQEIQGMSQGTGLKEKMTSKIKDNPLVPIGMLLTTCALSLGLWSMKKGNKRRSQLMMRARIYAQGFTISAILGGIIYASYMKPAKTNPSA